MSPYVRTVKTASGARAVQNVHSSRRGSHDIERTGWSIRKFVRTGRRYRTIQIQAGNHTITAADPLPDDLHHALDRVRHPGTVRTNLSQVGNKPRSNAST